MRTELDSLFEGVQALLRQKVPAANWPGALKARILAHADIEPWCWAFREQWLKDWFNAQWAAPAATSEANGATGDSDRH